MTPRFFDYDYNAREVIEYQRNGECNHCGDCCMTRIEFYGINRLYRGVWACVMEDDSHAFFQQVARVGEIGGEVCQQYTDDCRCGIYPDRLRMCRTFPMSPAQAALFPRCSYTFTEIERHPMGI